MTLTLAVSSFSNSLQLRSLTSTLRKSRAFSSTKVTKIVPSTYADPDENNRHVERLHVWTSHKVSNQVPDLVDSNLYLDDKALQDSLEALLPRNDDSTTSLKARAINHLTNLGNECGSQAAQRWSAAANANPPVLHQFDRYGRRIDLVDFHDSYHELMRMGVEHEVSSFAWKHEEPGALTVRSALYYLQNQADPGVCTPLAMTSAAIPLLRRFDAVWGDWRRLQSRDYDPRDMPLYEKASATIGLAMTEKQGGSDLKATQTTAKPINNDKQGNGHGYVLTGHKWFCSNPSGDGVITLAKTDKGDTAFLVPRWLPDGARNSGLQLTRLKKKLGDQSNATAEMEFNNAFGIMLGDEGQGLSVIMDTIHLNRLDCAVGCAGQMRAGLRGALHHAHYREVFGKKLVEQPLMANVLADLCAESEAATWMAMHLSKAYDDAWYDADQKAYQRVVAPIAKYFLAKKQPRFMAECLEALGGNGYTEEFGTSRAYAYAPYNSIWEGTSNVMCMDVLRAIHGNPDCKDQFLEEVMSAKGMDARVDSLLAAVKTELKGLTGTDADLGTARHLVDHMALSLQCAVMLKYADPLVTEVFLSNLERRPGTNYGSNADLTHVGKVINHALPV